MDNMGIFTMFRKRRADRATAQALYGALLAQARQPVFYTLLGVPDTTDGRFDMIALHGFMVMRAGPDMNRRMRQMLFDTIFRDFDRACREMGIGDLSVPRHMKRLMKAFKGRYFAYDAATQDPQLLAQALQRNLYRKDEGVDTALLNMMATYVAQSLDLVAQLDTDAFRAGRLTFAPLRDYDGGEQDGNEQQAA